MARNPKHEILFDKNMGIYYLKSKRNSDGRQNNNYSLNRKEKTAYEDFIMEKGYSDFWFLFENERTGKQYFVNATKLTTEIDSMSTDRYAVHSGPDIEKEEFEIIRHESIISSN